MHHITNREVVGNEINPNDEYYTPLYAITPILKYIKPNSNILCPFDTEESNFVIEFKRLGHNVICNHIFDGISFFLI